MDTYENTALDWIIWSHEHQAWWKAGRNGYSEFRKDAGIFTLDEALEICRNANCWIKDRPEETMLPAFYITD